METDNQVIAKWNEIKELMASHELDVAKNARGTAAAGLRVRKCLREVRNKAAALVKLTIELDKGKKSQPTEQA